MSQLLNTGLDKETLATCVSLIESGVNPEALAVRVLFRQARQRSENDMGTQAVVQELRRESAALKNARAATNGR